MDTKRYADGDQLLHLLYTQQFERPLLDRLFKIAEKSRALCQSEIGAKLLRDCLPHRKALLYFVQPSTRTVLSFRAAAETLGMSAAIVQDPRTSSEYKGESPLDSVHTFAMYHDLIVIRYPEAGFAKSCVDYFIDHGISKHIVNGGAGMEQHPTQALLDLYTLHREYSHRGGLDGRRIMVVGDLLRGRAVQSLIYLLAKYENMRIDLVSPVQLQLPKELKQYISAKKIVWRESETMDEFIAEADAIYMTRVQDEYSREGVPQKLDYSGCSLSADVIRQMPADCIVLHPLPRRQEIPLSFDADPRARYWDQVENGMWARVALIAHILGCEGKIRSA